MVKKYLVKHQIYLTFVSILLFYFITSVIYLNRVFIERNVSILNVDYNHFTLAEPEVHYYRNAKKNFSDSVFNLEDISVVPFFFTQPNAVLIIKISLTPKNKLELVTNISAMVSESERLLDAAIMSTKLQEKKFEIKGTTNISYFFQDPVKGFIKLFLYSTLFALIATAAIYGPHFLKRFIKDSSGQA